MLIFGIDTFGITRHKINSDEFNISDETLVRPYGDYIMYGSLLLISDYKIEARRPRPFIDTNRNAGA